MHETERRIIIAVLAEAVVFILILSLFIATIYKYHRAKLLNQRQDAQALIGLIEQERQRIGADLHDELGSLLALLKINLQGVEISNLSEKLALRKEIAFIDTLAVKIREVSNELMPQILNVKGVKIAIERLASLLSEASNVTIKLDLAEIVLDDKQKEIHLYRIAQELLNNCTKHAKASEIRVSLKSMKANIELTVMDNGVGFDSKLWLQQAAAGMGFKNILARADILGGVPFYNSAPGSGTVFQLNFPAN